ncbi:MAG: glutamine--tRNA ligase/YqeY domain fusion protein [Clostridia bacterium]|nr:glutamine--tRNA ligase/YqeY domain fusion protein [Clostridia bacterium]
MEKEFEPRNFIEEFIVEDVKKNPVVKTRFPPEPNGYPHIGHAKALFIDFSTAERFGGTCNLRFDDTNPTKEDVEYVEAIKEDILWLGFKWDKLCYGSDYFDTCYEMAVKLIKDGKAYVCDLDKDQIREYRGTLTEPGVNSPYRDRSVEENLDLFERMKNGEFEDGSRTLRAKIDMSSPNINMRDPALYRILHRNHHHTGDKWCIYPMYDFAHPIQDAIEGVTHSLCSLEYEAHRPLYNWVIDNCGFDPKPRQIEFARLNITNTIMSKRFLLQLVKGGYVSGWDDPRMPTLCAMRRRGYTPEAIKDFLNRAGVAKADSVVDFAMLEHCVREDLNAHADRVMAVIDPIKVVIENFPEDKFVDVKIDNLPIAEEGDEKYGLTHTVRFSKEIYIEREDFMIDPPKKFFRLKPDGEVRLKGSYIIKCNSYELDESGEVKTVYCTYDPESFSGECERKVKGTIHWVPVKDAVPAEFRLYDLLMTEENVSADDFIEKLNPDSVRIMQGFVEPYIASPGIGSRFQFMRIGYFCADPDTAPGKPVFNRTVSLKDGYRPNN